ncbi:hypothetical protein ACILPN_02085 [Yersinia wautersii]|uniref:Uncharacterized protein n=1 Tax=Yersinia pseudotuberculosis TaxID=633 RepID=A0A380QDH9_YERPU|nr:hypothetical protein [Yersinia pseudotuberculosis]SUP86391.1 Uncharacterised protein [Yersinia pseudotuberculosis]
MRMTNRKKEILSFYEPGCLEWVTGEIGAPPLDVSGLAYMLFGTGAFDNSHYVESTRRTLESMVKAGLLEKITSYEQRQNRTQSGGGRGVWCNVSRYALPGSCVVMRDDGGKREAIEGEVVRID